MTATLPKTLDDVTAAAASPSKLVALGALDQLPHGAKALILTLLARVATLEKRLADTESNVQYLETRLDTLTGKSRREVLASLTVEP